MSRIRILSDETINQIAAGEVIENPASVIKELVENALDAGSKTIFVEIKEGGFQLIRVIDSGSGMSPDEALLSLERHATSKIQEASDLSSIRTMGFRGEALASIAAISKLSLTTAVQDAPGTRLEVEAGRVLSLTPFPRKMGTTIEVKSLFYNVPARKKFQKSSSASTAEIHRLLLTLSLARPDVTFEFVSQEKVVFSFVGDSQLDVRIREVFGEEFAKRAHFIDQQIGYYHLRGYLGSPQESRLNRTGQYAFINHRAVSAPLISFAVKEGYGVRLDEGRFPVYSLHLEMPPDLVDVNVHPQKKEVRFQQESFLRQMVKEQVEKSFQSAPHLQAVFSPREEKEIFDWTRQTLSSLTFREDKESISLFKGSPELNQIGLFKNYLLLDLEGLESFVEMKEEVEEGIVWIDLPAAEEKLAFDRLTKKEESQIAQGLLVPVGIDLGREEALEIERKLTEIESMGFSIRSIGKQSFAIDAIPHFLAVEDIADVLRALSQEKEGEKQIVAKFARSRKKSFMLQEALALAEKILRQPAPHLSPSGALIVAVMRKNDIKHLFN